MRSWSTNERTRLREIWTGGVSRAAICAEFPDRTWSAIAQKAALMKLRRPRDPKRESQTTRKHVSPFPHIVETLRAERVARNLLISQHAKKIGYTCLKGWESGKANPSAFALQAWANSLGFELTLKRIEAVE